MSVGRPPFEPAVRGSIHIRPLTTDDLERVLEIEGQSFSTPWHESTFRGLLRRTDTDLLAAERGDQLIGYAVCWTVADQAELGNLAVAAEARGAGVGRLLIGAAMRSVRSRGARECFLEVRETNSVAQSLYRSCGFEVVGRRRGYYSRPLEDALVMRLQLPDSA
jgi:ribosomal-protein-alanine N-acetyltransferase